jgi:hypothetical protein
MQASRRRAENTTVMVEGDWNEGQLDELAHYFAFAGDPVGVFFEAGSAFVEFGTVNEAKTALRADGCEHGGRTLKVSQCGRVDGHLACGT